MAYSLMLKGLAPLLAASLTLQYSAKELITVLCKYSIFLVVRMHSHVNLSGRGLWAREWQLIIHLIKLFYVRGTKEQLRLLRDDDAGKTSSGT